MLRSKFKNMSKKVRKKILIVEDDLPLARVMKEKLTKENFIVMTAKNGQEGLELALAKQPDLILLDIVMPKMDGLSMLKKLREDKWGKEVPVVVLTNLGDADNIAKATERGAYDYLVKVHWKLGDVISKVKERLER